MRVVVGGPHQLLVITGYCRMRVYVCTFGAQVHCVYVYILGWIRDCMAVRVSACIRYSKRFNHALARSRTANRGVAVGPYCVLCYDNNRGQLHDCDNANLRLPNASNVARVARLPDRFRHMHATARSYSRLPPLPHSYGLTRSPRLRVAATRPATRYIDSGCSHRGRVHACFACCAFACTDNPHSREVAAPHGVTSCVDE